VELRWGGCVTQQEESQGSVPWGYNQTGKSEAINAEGST